MIKILNNRVYNNNLFIYLNNIKKNNLYLLNSSLKKIKKKN